MPATHFPTSQERHVTTAKKNNQTGTTANIHEDGDTVRRSVTIRRPMSDVRSAWKSAGLTGDALFRDAPGDLGTELHVTAPHEEQSAIKEVLGAWRSDDPGESLSTRLRQFKARLETGEVATTIGQPSGRDNSTRK